MNFRMTFGSVKRSMSRQEAALGKGQNETRIRLIMWKETTEEEEK